MLFLIGGLVTVAPTILVALLASTYYYFGIHTLFDEKIRHTVAETVRVAELYLQEHKDNIKTDALSIASNIYRNYYVLVENPELFDELLNKQEELRDLAEAMVFTLRSRTVLGKTSLSFTLAFDKIAPEDLKRAQQGEVVVLKNDQEDRVRALIKLDQFVDTYLLVGRYIDKEIINHLKVTKGSASQYHDLLKDIKATQVKLGLIFIISSALLCVIAILIAIKLAKIMSRPIQELVEATSKIKSGDYSVRVPERGNARDETAILARAFNSMTQKIAFQTEELMTAKNIIDERRRFIETVLGELSSGVMVVDSSDIITLCNQSGMKLLYMDNQGVLNQSCYAVFPEISPLLRQAQEQASNLIENNIIIERCEKKIYLFIRVAIELDASGCISRYIITFDDISKLIAAQRAAAWTDIARRIAHEIKNPLTPIHLSAEQIKKKFLKEIKSDQQAFLKYIDTITRHVLDIGNMVEEFVEFARIPSPKFARYDIYRIINEVIFAQKSIYQNITYEFTPIGKFCYVTCDRAQITQVLFNLIKNSSEAISSLEGTSALAKVMIRCDIGRPLGFVTIEVEDTGGGIPKDLSDRITEPYVTGKPTGTGLGLSIVKKIVEDHQGELSIHSTQSGTTIGFALRLSDE